MGICSSSFDDLSSRATAVFDNIFVLRSDGGSGCSSRARFGRLPAMAKKKAAKKKKVSAKKKLQPKKKRAPKLKKKVAARKKPARRKVRRPRGGRQEITNPVAIRTRRGLGSASGGQSGDTQGLSRREDVDSESVTELAEEGQDYEAGVVSGVENARDPDEGEVTTTEVPEDDVPPEYTDRDQI
jgi:hypothetical protein